MSVLVTCYWPQRLGSLGSNTIMSYTWWDPIPENIYVYNDAPLGALPPGPFIQEIPWPTRIAGPEPARHPYWYIDVDRHPPLPAAVACLQARPQAALPPPPGPTIIPYLWNWVFMQ